MPLLMKSACVVLVTFPAEEPAVACARALVDEGLAACVNIIARVRSIYRWKGAVSDENEILCVIKTTRERFEALRARVVTMHPYEVPEVIALGVEAGHEPYLDWLAGAVLK